MHKKGLKFAPLVELAKAGPGFDDLPEYPSVQIKQGSQAFGT